jgi:hypothetical protein
MRAPLVHDADVQRRPVAARVVARDELLLRGIDEDDEGARVGVVGGEALVEGDRRVLGLDGVVAPEDDLPPEAAGEVRPSCRRERPWTCSCRRALIASLVIAAGFAAGSTW